jgi:tetratricopeptide (TPR) repeat protein
MRLVLPVAVLLALLTASSGRAQIPDTFTNLQVLPKTISRDSLVGIMRGFSLSLNARCQYCHVGGDGVSFDGVRFADDDDEDKRKAREMLRMVQRINTEILPNLPQRDQPPVEVNCFTCHRGAQRPRMIEAVLAQTIVEAGADSAIAQYRRLRSIYYGRATFDFSETPLIELARILLRQGTGDVAERMLQLNLEFFPNSVQTYGGLAEVRLQRGDTAGAITALEKVLELRPQDAEARRRLEMIRRQASPPGLESQRRSLRTRASPRRGAVLQRAARHFVEVSLRGWDREHGDARDRLADVDAPTRSKREVQTPLFAS